MADKDDDTAIRETAERAIIAAVAGMGDRIDALPDTNVVAVGSIGFVFRPEPRQIAVRASVMYLPIWVDFPEHRHKIEQTLVALDDPAIGGMFETEGAVWEFDRERGYLFLAFLHPYDAPPDALMKSVEALDRVFPEWAASWLGDVGEIVHNGKPPPKRRVTPEDNPYRN